MFQLEAQRALTDWLRDPVTGVNAMLEALTLDHDADERPAPFAFIACEYDPDGGTVVVERLDPPALPAIYVREDGPFALTPETQAGTHRDTLTGEGVPIALRILDADPEAPRAQAARSYRLRALLRSIGRFLAVAEEAAQVRNGIQIVAAERVAVGSAREAVGDAAVTGAVLLALVCRETNP